MDGKSSLRDQDRYEHSVETFEDRESDSSYGDARGEGSETRDNADSGESSLQRTLFARLLTLPPELLPEICSHLSPFDLLRWGRTCKTFRSKFFVKTTVSLASWRSARRNVDLPDLVWPMDEPTYASMMYDQHCMGDGCDEVYSPMTLLYCNFGHRLRLCSECYWDTYVEPYGRDLSSTIELAAMYRRCLGFRPLGSSAGLTHIYRRDDLDQAALLPRHLDTAEFRQSVQAEIRAKEIDALKLEAWWRTTLEARQDARDDDIQNRYLQLLASEPAYALRCLSPSYERFSEEYEVAIDREYYDSECDWIDSLGFAGVLDDGYWSRWEKLAQQVINKHQDDILYKIWRSLRTLCLQGTGSPVVKALERPFLERIRRILQAGDPRLVPEGFLAELSHFFLFDNPGDLYSDPGYFPDYFLEEDEPSSSSWRPCPDRFDVCLVLVDASPLADQEIVTEEDLDNLGDRFECLLCESNSRKQLDWFDIVGHIVAEHPRSEVLDSIRYNPEWYSSNYHEEEEDVDYYEQEESFLL